MESVPSMRPERRDRSHGVEGLLGGGEEEGAGCKNAVEIVTRNSQKGELQALRHMFKESADLEPRSLIRYQQGWLHGC